MTIDEMISNLETATMLFSNVVIDKDGVSQLKSWLTELKELRSMVKSTAFKDGYEQGRADAISEISREMRLLYGNEYEKQIRAEAIDECIAIVSNDDCILEDYCNQQCVECICRRLKELKESQNES